MTTMIPETSKGQLVPLYFAQDAVAASQTDVQLVTPGETTTPLTEGYEMPWAGEVVGVSFTLNAAGSAGVFTIGATINGTEDADTALTVGTDAANYKRVPRGSARFSASDSIGAEISTDGSWNGTTSDLVVIVWVLVYMEGI